MLASIRGSLLLAFSLFAPCVDPAAAAERTLTILHTSEHHGTALPIERRGEPRLGGMAPRATLIASIREKHQAVLLLDSGDILIGSALSSFFRGEPDIRAMNLMGYHAMAAGNHDFDYGLEHLEGLSAQAQFPILCSNVTAVGGDLPCRPYTTVRVGDVTLGVISLLGHRNFPDAFNRDVVKLLTLTDPIASARTWARTLKERHHVDLVIAVTHMETEEDLTLLRQVPEVDVIIGGHTVGFDGLRSSKTPRAVEELTDPGPVFVKTHRQGRTLGRLDLVVATRPEGGATVLKARAWNLPVTEALAPDPEVYALLEGYSRKLEAESSAVIGRSLVNLAGENIHVRARETNLGNLLADLLRSRFETEIALVNGGQIRDSIPAGPVDIKRVLSVLPFDSTTVTFSLRGDRLLQALENSASRLPSLNGRFLQVSGLHVTYDVSAEPGSRVRKVMVHGEPLNPARNYTVATDSFLADGGDGYTMFASAGQRLDRQIPMRDLLLAALRARPLKASVRGRIRFVETPHPARGSEAD